MMRPAERKKIQWSPHNSNQFAVGGNDLRLYEIKTSDSNSFQRDDISKHFSLLPPSEVKPTEKKVITLVGAHTEIQSLKCFDWCLDNRESTLMAVGLATGRVLLANMGKEGDSVKKEFVPKQVRTCNAVSWNPVNKNLLATGLDKVRSDFSCLVWDVNESGTNPVFGGAPSSDSSSSYDSTSNSSSTDYVSSSTYSSKSSIISGNRENSFNLSAIVATERVERPSRQFANSEAVASLAWLPNTPLCLATGTGNRWLRIYDMRDALKPVSSVGAHSAKAIYGVCFDPHREHCLATFSEESIIKLWDTRIFKDPVMQLTAPGASASNKIVQIAWCPTRGAGILGAISKDENFVRVWNVNSGMILSDDQASKLLPASIGLSSTSSPHLSINSFNTQSESSLLNVPQKSLSANASNQISNQTNQNSKSNLNNPSLWATSDTYDLGTEIVSGFSWHPTKGQILTISANSIIEILNLHQPVPIAFSSTSRFCFSSQKALVEGPVLSKPSSSVSSIALLNQKNSASNSIASSSLSTNSNSSNLSSLTPSSSSLLHPSSSQTPQNSNQSSLSNLSTSSSVHSTSINSLSIDLQHEKEEALKGKRDISQVMMERAIRGYGGDAKINKTLVRTFDDPELEYVWNWLYDMKFNLAKKASEFKGIYALLTQSKNPQPSKVEETITFSDPVPIPPAITTFRQKYPVYSSTERTFCLKMCGWGFASSAELATALESVESSGRAAKAICLAVFHLDIQLAIQIGLKMNPSAMTTELRLIAMALGGFSVTPNASAFAAVCEPLRPQISDPYLCALLSFLCASKPDYWDVLYETDIELRDKIAFACRFYDDEKLATFLERTKVQIVGQGRLYGLLLTGIDSVGGGIELFQNYIDRTSDIQTPALLLSHISSRKIKDTKNRILLWNHIYRQMLDRWGLWIERAKFDVQRGEANPPPHVMARCNYCNANLTLGRDNAQTKAPSGMGRGVPGSMHSGMMGAGMQGGTGARWHDKKKITSCPSCRKPLPRCALCLLPMNCIPPSPENRQIGEGLVWSSGVQNFDDWFSWCQNCKHGGHAGHLSEWFKSNDLCPVSDCDCKCSFA